MVQTEIIIKNHGLCLQRNILVENVLLIMTEPTVQFVQKLLVWKVSRYLDHHKNILKIAFLKNENPKKCFGINKNRCFDCKDERICYADQVFQTPDNFWTKTKEGCDCKWKVN